MSWIEGDIFKTLAAKRVTLSRRMHYQKWLIVIVMKILSDTLKWSLCKIEIIRTIIIVIIINIIKKR